MKVNNALVTWNNLATMGLTAKGTPPTGNGIANKAEIIAAYYVNESAYPFSTYSGTRCPPYQTILSAVTTTTTTTCNPAANWTYQYQTCDSCVTKNVDRDLNPCSPTYLNYRSAGVNVGSTAPANTGACNTSQVWVVAFGSYNCYGTCNKYYVEVQNNPCASGYGNTRQGAVNEYNSTFCGGCCGQSTSANWVLAFGSYSCSGCNKYYNEIDNNPCSPTYGTVRISSTVAEYNSTFCGGCCGQSTAANWTVVFGTYWCSGCDKYYVERDLNSCSPTYLQYRYGAVAEYNSSYCCAGVLTCFSLTSGTFYYGGCNYTSNTQEIYTVTLKDQYGNTISNTTGSNLTFTFQYDYYDHEDYYYCEGGGTGYKDIIIAPGQSSGQVTFETRINQYCCYSSVCDGTCYSEEYNVALISAPLPSC